MKYDFIYFIGDSYTFGVGQGEDLHNEVTMENRYSQLVADELQLPLVNHAVPGCSNDYIARTITTNMLEYKQQGLNPLVIVCYTDCDRREMWYEAENQPTTINFEMPIHKIYITQHYNRNYNEDIFRYHFTSIKHMLKYMNFDFIETFSSREIPEHYERGLDNSAEISTTFIELAGDDGCFVTEHVPGQFLRGHLNVKGNKIIANHIIEKYKELYGTTNE